MKDFIQNKCRLCNKTLCCLTCRIHHEQDSHKIHAECDICIYGKLTVKDASSSLLKHLKSEHWPLHCVHCNTIISSIDDLLSNHKCRPSIVGSSPAANDGAAVIVIDNLSATPKAQFIENLHVPSPVLTPFYKKFMSENTQIGMTITMGITSTPMQIRQDFQTPQQIMTPNDLLEMKTAAYKSSLKLTASSGTPNNSKKNERRVTFSETPMLGIPKKYQETLTIMQKFVENGECSQDHSDSFHTVSSSGISDVISNGTPRESNKKEEHLPDDDKNDGADDNSENLHDGADEISENLWESVCTTTENNGSSCLYLTSDSRLLDTTNDNTPDFENSMSLWTSMRKVVRSVISNIPLGSRSFSELNLIKKRAQPEEFSDNDDVESANRYKRMKFSEIKCRRTIRELGPLHQIRLSRPKCVDKSTQTEDDLFM